MKTNKPKFAFVILLLLLLASGFIRDFFMININHVLNHLVKGYENFAYSSFYFLEKWTVKEIMILKWGLTIFFSIYFGLLSYFTLASYFQETKRVLRSISAVFIGLIGIAGLLFLVGKMSGIDKSMYHVVRTLTGLTHSFLPAMVVFLYLKYFPEEK